MKTAGIVIGLLLSLTANAQATEFFCKSVAPGQTFAQGAPFMQAQYHAGRLMVTAYGQFAREFESDGPYVFQHSFRLAKVTQRAEIFTEGSEHASWSFQLVTHKTKGGKFFKAFLSFYHDEGGFDHRYALVCKRM